MKKGGLAEKRFSMTMRAYEEAEFKFHWQRQQDLYFNNPGDFLVSYDGILHAIEVKQISVASRTQITFREIYKRDQIHKNIKFSKKCPHHNAWYFLIFWNDSARSSPAYLIPASKLLLKMEEHDLKHFKMDEMMTYFYFERLDIFNNKFYRLDQIFNRGKYDE